MKNLSLILIIAGIIVLVLGVYGFITVDNSGVSGKLTDSVIDVIDAVKGEGTLNASESIKLFLVRNRILLTIVGAASLVSGGLLLTKKKTA